MNFSSPFESLGLDNDTNKSTFFEHSYGNPGIEADNSWNIYLLRDITVKKIEN